MGLRPARTCRTLGKVPWTRYSKRRPRKSFVKALPANTVQIYHMGKKDADYEFETRVVAKFDVQIRDNALESARQSSNKYLEKSIPMGYYLGVKVIPHNVIRENKMILGAGADRLQKGMRKAYGRPTDRAARIRAGQPVFRIRFFEKDTAHIREAIRRIKMKLPGEFIVDTKTIAA